MTWNWNWKRTAACGALALAWAPPGGAQETAVDPIRAWVFAAPESTDGQNDEVVVRLPPRHPVPRDPDRYYFKADRGQRAAESLTRRLERPEYADTVLVVASRDQADMYLKVIATIRLGLMGLRQRDDGITVVRVFIRNHDYTTDFIGERRGAIRPPAFALAGQLTRWITSNYAMLQRLVYGLP